MAILVDENTRVICQGFTGSQGMRVPALIATSLLAASPAAAQQVTLEQAARTNLTIALQFCITPGVSGETRASWFRQAGFTERAEITGGDSTFHFHAPADTAAAELYFGHMPEHCVARTQHLGVTEASALLDSIAPSLYPGYLRRQVQGPVDPATGRPAVCVSYEDPTNPIGYAVSVTHGDPGSGSPCIENGTSAIFRSARV